MKRLVLPLALLAFLGVACKKAKTEPARGMTAAQLLTQGERELKQGKWNDGRRTLRVIEEQLPGAHEYAATKLLIADSFFFQGSPSYPEAAVEYEAFLNYFPKHERRDYALYHLALCEYASIESAERDQTSTRKAIEAFERLIREAPGSPYIPEARAKLTQCWRRIAEHEVVVGIFYVNTYHYDGAEVRLKGALEKYPDFVDRERAYYYLGEAMRQKFIPVEDMETFRKAHWAKLGKEDNAILTPEEAREYLRLLDAHAKEVHDGYQAEARAYYQKLVESYPGTDWARRAKDRLLEMGQQVKEELDS